MICKLGMLALLCSSFSAAQVTAQPAAQPAPQAPSVEENSKIQLTVPPGSTLRLYLTKRVSKRQGAAVEGKLLEPVFAFDREVVPAGTVVRGEVARVHPVNKWQRARSILNGDFTPLRTAEVEFRTLLLPDGRTMAFNTVGTLGLNSIYTEPTGTKKKAQSQQPQNQNGGLLGTAKQKAKEQITAAVNAKQQGVYDMVRGPNKKEKLIDYMWAKAPYHPQYLRRGARFDAPLREALQFGAASVPPADFLRIGTQPAADSVVHVRLTTAVNSGTAKTGENVEAVTTAPLFSADHKLILPEGTKLTGMVVVARKGRYFHRPGQLRFNFQKIEMPPEIVTEIAAIQSRAQITGAGEAGTRESVAGQTTLAVRPEPMQTVATLSAAESGGTTPIEVDSEGGVKAKESKTRFLAPAISLVLASRAADNEVEKHHGVPATGNNPNIAGRTLGGGLGFGMLGSAVSQSSKYVGMAFGYYGLAWSVYTNMVARGAEVQFEKDAMMDIKFGARTPLPGAKFRGLDSGAGQ
jgi:hypothetical protein